MFQNNILLYTLWIQFLFFLYLLRLHESNHIFPKLIKEIIKQFNELIEKINLNEIEVKEKIKADVERFSKLQKFLLGTKEKVSTDSVDVRGYAKFVLKEGSDIEKRELLGCLKSKICLANKKITLKS